MYLFSRTVLLTGPPAESGAFADRHASVRRRRDRSRHRPVVSGVRCPARFDDRTRCAIERSRRPAVGVGTAARRPRLPRATRRRSCSSAGAPAVDNLAQPMLGELGDESPPSGRSRSLTTATMAGGKYAEAIGWGIDVAQHVTKVSGMPDHVPRQRLRHVRRRRRGSASRPTWLRPTPPAHAVNSDADYLAKLDASASSSCRARGNRMLLTRIA